MAIDSRPSLLCEDLWLPPLWVHWAQATGLRWLVPRGVAQAPSCLLSGCFVEKEAVCEIEGVPAQRMA